MIIVLSLLDANAQVAAVVSNPSDPTVQCDYATVQDAIDAASPGDVVRIGEDTFEYSIVVDKELTLTGVGSGCFCVQGVDCGGSWQPTIDADFKGTTLTIDTPDPVRIYDLNLVNGLTATNGGNLRLEDGADLYANRLVTEKGEAPKGRGGNVYLARGATLEWSMSGRYVGMSDGRAIDGGNLYADTGASVWLKEVIVEGGTAERAGGNLAAVGASLVLEDSKVDSGLAGSDGGGIYASKTSVSLLGTDVYSNHADRDGGGVWFKGKPSSGPALHLAATALLFNSTDRDGGGAWVSGRMTMVSRSQASVNGAVRNGGGIHLLGLLSVPQIYDGAPAPIEVNGNAATDGGGLYVRSTSGVSSSVDVAVLLGLEANNNRAYGNGGGYFLSGSSSNVVTNLRNIEASSNRAAHGAGLHVDSGFTKVVNSHLLGNRASVDGGGAYVAAGARISVDKLVNFDLGNNNPDCRAGGNLLFNYVGGSNLYCNTWSGNRAEHGAAAAVLGIAELDSVGMWLNVARTTGHALYSATGSGLSATNLMAYWNGSGGVGYVVDLNDHYSITNATIARNATPAAVHSMSNAVAIFRNSIVDDGFVKVDQATMNATCTLFTTVPSGPVSGSLRFHGSQYNPAFITTARGRLRLGAGSDAANVCTGGSATDIDGKIRPNSGQDMGALR